MRQIERFSKRERGSVGDLEKERFINAHKQNFMNF